MTRCAKRMLAVLALATAAVAGVPLGFIPGSFWGGVPGSAAQGDAGDVDLELLLAVDTSSSVSATEFDLQMRGLAEAFRHPAVLAAIQAVGDLGIAVALIQWSDARNQLVAIDWMVLRGEADAGELAQIIDTTPRFVIGGGTAVGAAIEFAARQFADNGYEGLRRVIDVSGDGRSNQGPPSAVMRDAAVAQGIIINGLAILDEEPFLDRYYSQNVIGGTGAFMMTVANYESFAEAIVEKLVKDISGVPVAAAPSTPAPLMSAGSAPGS